MKLNHAWHIHTRDTRMVKGTEMGEKHHNPKQSTRRKKSASETTTATPGEDTFLLPGKSNLHFMGLQK